MKILTIGGATVDLFLQYANVQTATISNNRYIILEEGKKVELQNIESYTGGGATNSAASFSRLGFATSALFKVGDDCQGHIIIDELKKMGVTSIAAVASNSKTSTSIIIPSPSGDRTVLTYRGAPETLTKTDIPADLFAGVNQLYISSFGTHPTTLLPYITKTAKECGATVTINPGSSQLQAGAASLLQALPHTDILIMNKSEAELFMAALQAADSANAKKINKFGHPEGSDSVLEGYSKRPDLSYAGSSTPPNKNSSIPPFLHTYFKTVLTLGPRIAVVTDGATGVYVATAQGAIFHPSVPVAVTSSVGAGDAFGSCFVALLAHGASVEDATRCAVVNAASVITHVGAKTGLLDLEEVKKRAAALDQKLLKSFNLE